jgi:hypothetical protein
VQVERTHSREILIKIEPVASVLSKISQKQKKTVRALCSANGCKFPVSLSEHSFYIDGLKNKFVPIPLLKEDKAEYACEGKILTCKPMPQSHGTFAL